MEKRWLLIALTTSCIWGMTILAASKAHAQCTTCNGSFLIENYTTATGWTTVPSSCAGSVTIAGGSVLFNNAQESRSKRVYRNIPTLNYDDWTAEADVMVTGNNAGSMDIIAFTSGTLDPWHSDATCPAGCTAGNCATLTDQDGIFAYIGSGAAPPTSAACCQNPTNPAYPWSFFARAKKGTTLLPPSLPINLPPPAFGINYYVRLQRTWHSQGMISVFTDPAMTIHVAGSPKCFPIDPDIRTLNVLQHGVHTQGSNFRVITAKIDNLRVCSGNTCPLSLTPSFTVNSAYCSGTPIAVNGSATTGTPLQEVNHEWLITESDQFGVTTTNPATTWSQWVPGPAGAFTFPSSLYAANGGFIQCGKYYLVQLAVQNCGNRWVPTSHVIRINCNPNVTINGPNWICQGGTPTTLTATFQNQVGAEVPPSPTTSYLWTPGGQTTSSITVPSATNSSQTLTVTDINGCQGTASHPVNVAPAALNIDITTGISNTTGAFIPYGSPDDTWKLRGVPGNLSGGPGSLSSAAYAALPFVKVVQPYQGTFASWVAPVNERWVSNASNSNGIVAAQPASGSNLSPPHSDPTIANSFYWYEFQFNLPLPYNNLAVNIQEWARDNAVDLYMNPGNLNAPSNPVFSSSGSPLVQTLFSQMSIPPLTNNQSFFQLGTNRLLVRQFNLSVGSNQYLPSPTGFVLRGSITGQCSP